MPLQPCGHTAALADKVRGDRDQSAAERLSELDGARQRAAAKLCDVAFICEAFTEMDEVEILAVGRFAARSFDAAAVNALELAIGHIVARGLRRYARRCGH